MNKKDKLLFVYNANSSIFSVATDYVHKIVSPETYSCNLCKLTYGNLGMKKEWKDFIVNIDVPVSFLHKDELTKEYPDKNLISLPVIFVASEKGLSLLISSEEINNQNTISNLISLIKNKMKNTI